LRDSHRGILPETITTSMYSSTLVLDAMLGVQACCEGWQWRPLVKCRLRIMQCVNADLKMDTNW